MAVAVAVVVLVATACVVCYMFLSHCAIVLL